MRQILIVEDDITLNQGLCKALKSDEWHIVSCGTIEEARGQLLIGEAALVLLDINLPDGDGIDLLKEIKSRNRALPVILLTAKDTDLDIVNGLEQGADDYITKPFSLSVLRARVNTQLRKAGMVQDHDVFADGEYSFDFKNMIFAVSGEVVELSKTEQKLLRILTENVGRVVKRDILIDKIWTDGAEYVDENALSVSVKRIRDKLRAADKIKTVYGLGYSWVEHDE
ncbi:MAG: response regulator transcription factor [Butyrivibrio sp.]|nr:response regulator transcription factor [Butyrivibrio sp.]